MIKEVITFLILLVPLSIAILLLCWISPGMRWNYCRNNPEYIIDSDYIFNPFKLRPMTRKEYWEHELLKEESMGG